MGQMDSLTRKLGSYLLHVMSICIVESNGKITGLPHHTTANEGTTTELNQRDEPHDGE